MKAVIFDFDGTIADSLMGGLALLERAHHNNIPFSSEEIDDFRQKSFLQIAKELNVPMWKILWLAIMGSRLFAQHIDKVQVYSGVPALLRKLHQNDVKIFIVSTNKSYNIQAFLREHKLENYIQAVYGSAWYFNKAPRLRALLRQEGLNAEDVVSIGDETIDIVSARRVGLKIYSVSWGYAAREKLSKLNPDGLFDTVAGLQKELLQ